LTEFRANITKITFNMVLIILIL